MDALDSAFDPLRDFSKDSKEFTKVAARTATGGDFTAVKLEKDADDFDPPATSPAKTKAEKMGSKSHRGSGSRGRAESSSDGDDARAGYTEAETKVLARCWVDVSVVGNNQKESYWRRILHKYRENRPDKTPKRNGQKLRNHWDRVKNSLAEFQQWYEGCEMQHRSGESEADVLSRALIEWQNMKGAPFKHIETWRIVKDTPKFAKVLSAKYPNQAPPKRTKTGEDGSYAASANDSASGSNPSMGTPRSGNESSSWLERPMGSDGAEAVARGKKKVGASDTAVQLAKAIATMQEAIAAYTRTSEYHIVMRNTDKMEPGQKTFHEKYVEMIKKKHGWDF